MTTAESVLICPIDETELELQQLEGGATCWVCPTCEARRRHAKPSRPLRAEMRRFGVKHGGLRLGDRSAVNHQLATDLAAGVLSEQQALEAFDGCSVPRIAPASPTGMRDRRPTASTKTTVEPRASGEAAAAHDSGEIAVAARESGDVTIAARSSSEATVVRVHGDVAVAPRAPVEAAATARTLGEAAAARASGDVAVAAPLSDEAATARADEAPIELFYDSIAEDFDRIMNRYDLQRRVDTIFDTLLGHQDLRGRTLLDAGCGTGWFSQRAWERGAQVTALDIGPRLLREVRAKCPARTVCGDVLNMQFDDGAFDVVVSSECIEHTRNPARAVRELVRVCRPGGLIVITCPNRFWYWLCVVANRLHLRPYEGIEDWPRWTDLRRWIEGANACVVEMRGVHLFPFQLSIFHPLLRLLDRFGKLHGRFCVNIAALAVKQC